MCKHDQQKTYENSKANIIELPDGGVEIRIRLCAMCRNHHEKTYDQYKSLIVI